VDRKPKNWLNDADSNDAAVHIVVAKLNFEVAAWNNHSNEANIITVKEC